MTNRWTEQQEELIKFAGNKLELPRVAVLADAGSGKTATLVERAIRFRNAYQESEREKLRILCVSFTEKSKADLENRLYHYPEIEVYTIHGFCARIVQEFGNQFGLPPMISILSADEEKELFHESFTKVFRRHPLPTSIHSPSRYFKLAKTFKEMSARNLEPIRMESETPSDHFLFCKEVIEDFNKSKKLKYKLEYSDLEWFAYRYLQNPEIALIIQKRYSHIFVDEFQDTSPIQSYLVNRISGSSIPLFVVGDEKQSIYRFRGARVEVFREFVKNIGVSRKLTKNFRSLPSVIETVNKICAPCFDEYVPMTAGINKDAFDIDFGVIRIDCDEEANGIAEAIRQIEEKGGDRSQTVLLLRKLKGKEKLFSKLESMGINLVVDSTGLTSGSAIQKLINLWIYTCYPWKKVREAQVLMDFSEIFKTDLYQLKEKIESTSELFGSAIPMERADEFLSFLDQKLNLSKKYGIAFEEFSVFIMGQVSKGKTPLEIAQEMELLIEDEERIPDLIKYPPPGETEGALRVMTIHSSKGLEFPFVIMADLDSRSESSSGLVESGNNLHFAGRDEEGELLKSSRFEQAEEIEKESTIQESYRLLYVALTRAECGLVLVTKTKTNVKKQEDPKKPKKWAEIITEAIPNCILVEGVPKLKLKEESKLNGYEKIILNQKPTYEKARVGATEYLEDKNLIQHHKKRESHSDFKGDPNYFTDIGNRVHDALQFEDWDALKVVSEEKRIQIEPFLKWITTEEGKFYFDTENSEWDHYKEFAFEVKINSGPIITGRIDSLLVSKTSENEAIIVDYKVLHSKRSANEFIAEYSPQMNLYIEAVKKLTGYSKVSAILLDISNRTGKVLHKLSL